MSRILLSLDTIEILCSVFFRNLNQQSMKYHSYPKSTNIAELHNLFLIIKKYAQPL